MKVAIDNFAEAIFFLNARLTVEAELLITFSCQFWASRISLEIILT